MRELRERNDNRSIERDADYIKAHEYGPEKLIQAVRDAAGIGDGHGFAKARRDLFDELTGYLEYFGVSFPESKVTPADKLNHIFVETKRGNLTTVIKALLTWLYEKKHREYEDFCKKMKLEVRDDYPIVVPSVFSQRKSGASEREIGPETATINSAAAQEQLEGKTFLENELGKKIARKRKGQTTLICLADIDRLSQINKRYGENIGNLVIDGIRSTLQSTFANRPHFTGRCGDDTFYFIFFAPEDAPLKSNQEEVENVCDMIATRSWGDIAYGLHVSCSIGFAILREDERAELAVARAAIAMNKARERGGNQVAFAPYTLPRELVEGTVPVSIWNFFSGTSVYGKPATDSYRGHSGSK